LLGLEVLFRSKRSRRFQTLSLMRFLKRMRLLFRFGNNLQPTLQYVVDNVRCVVVESQILMPSVVIVFPMQRIRMPDLLRRIADGRFLLPNVEELRMNQGARTVDQLSELELSMLMMNTNQISVVLGHLHGVIGDLQTVQVQERVRRLTVSGESGSLETVATQVAERALDVEFGDLSISCIDAEMEDFGDNVDQEGPA